MIIELNKFKQNINNLDNFIENELDSFENAINKTSRVNLLKFKKDFKSLILLNKKKLKKLDVTNAKHLKFINLLLKISENLFLKMEFKTLSKILGNKINEDNAIIKEYFSLEDLGDFYNFNDKFITYLSSSKNIDKKYINNIAVNYYLYLKIYFNSKDILIDFENKLIQGIDNNNLNLISKTLFLNIFNISDNENIQIKILEILDNYDFNDESNNKIELTKNENHMNLQNIKHTPTEEQAEIIKTSKTMKTGQVLIVDALAGCTKTSTLEMVTRANSDKQFLYLAFNTKIVEEAKRRFPKNTEVRTLHSLGYNYEGKGKVILNNLNHIISELFGLKMYGEEFFKIYEINKIFEKFCLSEFKINELNKLERRLISEIEKEYEYKPENQQYRKKFAINKIEESIPYIERLYNYMLEMDDKITHSFYLKKFVENINNYSLDYDFIVLDESQDVSRLLAKFIINRILSGKYKIIIVGDNNQKIYGFLGNINLSKAIKRIVDDSIYIEKHLTKTFRFAENSEMENLTNLILNRRNIEIVGAGKEKKLDKESKNSIGYLSRSKLAVLEKAFDFLRNNTDYNLFMDKEKDFNINLITDIYNLYLYTMRIKKKLISENKISKIKLEYCEMGNYTKKEYKKDIEDVIKTFKKNKDNSIIPKYINKRFKDIDSIYELEYNISHNDTNDILDSLKIVYFIVYRFEFFNDFKSENYYTNLVDKALSILVDKFSNKDSLNVISTIHKVKGLEFDEVILISSIDMIRKTITSINDDTISSTGALKGKIIGLCSASECKHEEKKKKNFNIKSITDKFEIDFENAFNKKETHSNNKKISLNDLEKSNKNNHDILPKLLIDRSIKDIQEEYNILYVAITRAKSIITIANPTYNVTLNFLKFLERNSKEIDLIMNGKKSQLLVQQIGEKGIFYSIKEKRNFITLETLKEFLNQFRQYNQ